MVKWWYDGFWRHLVERGRSLISNEPPEGIVVTDWCTDFAIGGCQFSKKEGLCFDQRWNMMARAGHFEMIYKRVWNVGRVSWLHVSFHRYGYEEVASVNLKILSPSTRCWRFWDMSGPALSVVVDVGVFADKWALRAVWSAYTCIGWC